MLNDLQKNKFCQGDNQCLPKNLTVTCVETKKANPTFEDWNSAASATSCGVDTQVVFPKTSWKGTQDQWQDSYGIPFQSSGMSIECDAQATCSPTEQLTQAYRIQETTTCPANATINGATVPTKLAKLESDKDWGRLIISTPGATVWGGGWKPGTTTCPAGKCTGFYGNAFICM